MKVRRKFEKCINFSLISNCVIFNILAGSTKNDKKEGNGSKKTGCSNSGKDGNNGNNETNQEQLTPDQLAEKEAKEKAEQEKKAKEAKDKAEREKREKEEAERKEKELKSAKDEFVNKFDKIFSQISIINDPEKYEISFENKKITKSDIENCKFEDIGDVRNKLTQLENELKNTYIQIQNKIIDDIKSIDKKLEDLKKKGGIPLFEKNPYKEEDVKNCIFDDLDKLKDINKLYNGVILHKKIINLESPEEIRNFLLSEINGIIEMSEIFGGKDDLDSLKKDIEKNVKNNLSKEDLKNVQDYLPKISEITNNLSSKVNKYNSDNNKIIETIKFNIKQLKIKIDYFANIDCTYKYEDITSKLTIKSKKTDKTSFETKFNELKNKNEEKIKEYKTAIINLITKLNEKYFNGTYKDFKLKKEYQSDYEKYKNVNDETSVNTYSNLLENIIKQIKDVLKSLNSGLEKQKEKVKDFTTLTIGDRYLKDILKDDFRIKKMIVLKNVTTGFDTEETQYFIFDKDCAVENANLKENLDNIIKKQESNEFSIEDQVHEIILELNTFIGKYNDFFDNKKFDSLDYFKGSFEFNESNCEISNVKTDEFLFEKEIKIKEIKIPKKVKIVNKIRLNEEYLKPLTKGNEKNYKEFNSVLQLKVIVTEILNAYNLTKKSFDEFIGKLDKIYKNNLVYHGNEDKTVNKYQYGKIFSEHFDYLKRIQDYKLNINEIKKIYNFEDMIEYDNLINYIINANFFCNEIFKDKELSYNKDGEVIKIKFLDCFVNNFEFFKYFEDFYFFYLGNFDKGIPMYDPENGKYYKVSYDFRDIDKKLQMQDGNILDISNIDEFKKLFNVKIDDKNNKSLDKSVFNYKFVYDFIKWVNEKMKEIESKKK